MTHDPIAEFVEELAETKVFQRIKDVSFLGVVDRDLQRTRRNATTFSRADHSIAVTFLARRFCMEAALSERDSVALVAAAMLHDIAHPAFSHSLEFAFSKSERHYDHHLALKDLLFRPSQRSRDLFRVLERYAVRPERIWDILSDEDELSFALLSPINIDTIDGITRAYWSIGTFVKYDTRILVSLLSRIFIGQSETRPHILAHADSFWRHKGAFYERFMIGREGSMERSFQHDVRERIDSLDLTLFEISDKDFELRYPEIVRRDRSSAPLRTDPPAQHFSIDESITTLNKVSIYLRYRRERRGNDNSDARAASAR